MLKKTLFLALSIFALNFSQAQEMLVDTFPFELINDYNSFWGITDVDGKLHLGSDFNGTIFPIDALGNITSSIETDDPIDFNHGMIWDGTNYWVVEDYSSGGASIYEISTDGTVGSIIKLPEVIGGNSSGVGDLCPDGNNFWYTVYYPDFDEYPYNYAYLFNTSTLENIDTIPLFGGQVYGIAKHNDHIFYVTDDLDGDEEKIYIYSLSEQDTIYSFPLLDPDGDSSPRGLHYFDGHLYLLAKRLGGSAFQFAMLYKYKIDLEQNMDPNMSISIENLDFGIVDISQDSLQTVSVENVGAGPLTIMDITSDNPVFSFSSADLPFVIPAGEASMVDIVFEPEEVITYAGILSIESNSVGSDAVQTINLTGNGKMSTDLQNAEFDAKFSIFPNPSAGDFTISWTDLPVGNLEISIVNNLGQEISKQLVNSERKEILVAENTISQSGIFQIMIYQKQVLIATKSIQILR